MNTACLLQEWPKHVAEYYFDNTIWWYDIFDNCNWVDTR